MELNISVQTVVPLYHLAQYFEIDSMRRDALEFINKKLLVTDCPTIVQHAMIFNADAILEAAAALVGKNIRKVQEDMAIVRDIFCPQLWLQISSHVTDHRRFSTRIAWFIYHHKEALNSRTFMELTSEKNMPAVSSTSVFDFLYYEWIVCGSRSYCNKSLTPLQKRCVSVIAERGVKFPDSASAEEQLWEVMQNNPTLMKELFLLCIKGGNAFGVSR
eukprot:Sro1573_g283460.2  (217) ;mRNA; r:14427-15077